MHNGTIEALDATRFAALMASLGPFEPRPRVAVGVSGGADSMALVLLAAEWARARGGEAVALTVDHGLRPEAADEAAQVGVWMRTHGVPHHILRSATPIPRRNVQAEARALRHALLRDWCRRNAILHLLLAHHREDQAETLLLRLTRGSGASGLAGMAAVSWVPEVRILRPFLPVSRAALEATLYLRGQAWVRDPSNTDTAYGRVRMRRLLSALDHEGGGAGRLSDTARRLGAARRIVEDAAAALLAEAVVPHPAGFVHLDPAPFAQAESEVALRALRAVLAAVGGRAYGPRAARIEALLPRLGEAATIGGCRLVPTDGGLLVVREARGLPRLPLDPGEEGNWDGRFHVRLNKDVGAVVIAALGTAGWRAVVAESPAPGLAHRVPGVVRPTLPAVWRDDRLLCVPHLGWISRTAAAAGEAGRETGTKGYPVECLARVRWSPSQPVTAGAFRLASARSSII